MKINFSKAAKPVSRSVDPKGLRDTTVRSPNNSIGGGFGLNHASPEGDWILATGLWADSGSWKDSSDWID